MQTRNEGTLSIVEVIDGIVFPVVKAYKLEIDQENTPSFIDYIEKYHPLVNFSEMKVEDV